MSRASSLNLMKILKKEVVRSVDMMAFDVMDQLSVEIFAFFNIILCKIRNSNIYMGGVLIIFLWIVLRSRQLESIHYWHYATLYLASKQSHFKILCNFPMMIYSNRSINWTVQLLKDRRWTWYFWQILNVLFRKPKLCG